MEPLESKTLDQVMDSLDPEFKPKRPPTYLEYKSAMRQFFTQRHQQVERCGHKFHPTNPPTTNCPDCWIAYFQVHGEITQLCIEIHNKEGIETLIRLRGAKYAKNFIKFMSALAQYQKDHVEQGTGPISNSDSEGTNSNTTDTSGEMEDAGGGWQAATETI